MIKMSSPKLLFWLRVIQAAQLKLCGHARRTLDVGSIGAKLPAVFVLP